MSCKKDKSGPTYVTGVISEKGSGNPIGSATIFLGRNDKNSFSSTTIQTIQTVSSNSNGEYSIKYEEDDNYVYYITVRRLPYYESSYYTPRKGEKNILNIALSCPGYVKLKIKNITGADRIAIGYPCTTSCDFYGTSVDTITEAMKININENLKFYWLAYKYGVDTTKDSANVSIPAFDTTIFNLNY